MASKAFAATALLLSLNLLFFSLVTSTSCPWKPNPTPKPPYKSPCSGKPNPTPKPPNKPPAKMPPAYPACPRDALKLGVCADLLGLVNVVIGSPPTLPCCSLLQGLVDLEAAVCLCTAIKANILGINLNVPVSLNLLLNSCGRTCPSGFECA
ncbi:hypothetical protein ACLOJK_033370 [Asimina triloba]